MVTLDEDDLFSRGISQQGRDQIFNQRIGVFYLLEVARFTQQRFFKMDLSLRIKQIGRMRQEEMHIGENRSVPWSLLTVVDIPEVPERLLIVVCQVTKAF